MVLSCTKITKAFGINEVLKNATFSIQKNEKVGLVGVNGAGKSTIFKIITKEMHHDTGDIMIAKDVKNVGHLTQMLDLEDEASIYDTFIEVFRKLIEMEQEIRDTEKEMAHVDEDDYDKIMKKYADLTYKFERDKGYEYKSRVRGVIHGLGFSEEEGYKKIKVLSGGEKTRVSLGKLLLTNPDILLLDEPTNHLDIESIEWLEDYLREYEGSVLVISHDRYFIDKIATKIVEVENGKTETYLGNYTEFIKRKEINRQLQTKHYLDQQKEIKRQESVIKQLRQFNREKSIKRAESREKLLDKMEKVQRPENAPKVVKIKIKPKIKSGMEVLKVKDLSKSFGENKLFEDVSFQVRREEKIALIGPNGIGKTTIIKMLLDEIEKDSGEIKFGTNVMPGYYDQEHQDLDDEKQIFDDIHDSHPSLTILEIRNALASFVFLGDDVYQKVGTLSGGEKGRVALAKIMLSKSNFLLLDEPTNHLDIISKEILEEAIRNYEGTVFYVSHDRYFINNTAEKIIELSENGVTEYLGNYDYYLEKKKEMTFDQVEEEVIEVKKEKKDNTNRTEQRRLRTQIRNIENEIAEIEERVDEIDHLLTKEEVATDYEKSNELFQEKTKKESKLEKLLKQWEEYHL